MYADAIYSHYQYVKGRVLQANSSRLVAGLLEAQDWPPKEIKLEAFYILTLGDSPSPHGADSAYINRASRLIQWVWTIVGRDTGAGVRANNRGDRFSTNQAMKDELKNALYPFYCEKKTWGMNANGLWIGTAHSPVEFITWGRPKFTQRLDKSSGTLYAACSVSISDMLDEASPA